MTVLKFSVKIIVQIEELVILTLDNVYVILAFLEIIVKTLIVH